MSLRNLYCFIGLSGSGKSTIVKNLMGIFKDSRELLSYTDRPKRGDDDCSHTFMTRKEMNEFLNETHEDDIVAYAAIDGSRYFATREQVETSDYYIIDENGLDMLKKAKAQGLISKDIYVVKITSDFETMRNRMTKRDGRIKTSMRLSFDHIERLADFNNVECDIEISNRDTDCLAVNVKKIADFIHEKERC